MMLKKTCLLLTFFYLILFFSTTSTFADTDFDFKIGTGIHDITGPPAEVTFMGFAVMEQKGEGIHMRLWSRAFAIEDNVGNNLMLVSADVGWISQAVKQAVVKKLSTLYNGKYTSENVLIQAQHTHSGPGGFTHYFTYNVPTLGFIEQNFDIIVNGIVQSIIKADTNIKPGTIYVNKGKIDDCGENRSSTAYENNPEEEKDFYGRDTDNMMTLLKFVDSDGTPVGMINWYAIHTNTMGITNKLISGDNKGYASYLFEKEMGTDYSSDNTFVGAFAMNHSGDISPNMQFTGETPDPDGQYDYQNLDIIGTLQYEKAIALFESADTPLTGTLKVAHEHVNFANLPIEGSDCQTCPAAMGSSFAAGSTEDGFTPAPIWPEGFTTDDIDYSDDFGQSFLTDLLPAIFPIIWPELNDDFKDCHYPKPILFPNGIMTFEKDDDGVDIPALPEVLPMQLVQIGEFVIIAPPSEITTMAGRRLKQSVSDIMTDDAEYYVIAALSNAYIGYVTTKEEYDMQHYEGGHNQFGPWALKGYQQEFSKLADSLKNGTVVTPGPEPRDIAHLQKTLHIGVVWDGKLLREEFGQIFDEDNNENYDAEPFYNTEETVRVSFVGGHPNNTPEKLSTFLEVVKVGDPVTTCRTINWFFFKTTQCETTPGETTIIETDNSPDTKYIWERHHTDRSRIDIEWTIPKETPSGTYKINHYGYWKDGNPFSSTFTQCVPYQGSSSEFTIE